jgi:hypothetical protein
MSNDQKDSESGLNPLFLVAAALVVGSTSWWHANGFKIKRWYYNHYEEIYLFMAAI